jgi:ferrous iron transport protein B
MDEAERNNIQLDTRTLARELGIPVVATSARYQRGIPELLQTINEIASGNLVCKPRRIKNVPEKILKAVTTLSEEIETEFPNIPNSRWIAFRLLEGDNRIIEALKTGEFV